MRHDGVPCALPRQSNESGIIPQHIVARSRATYALLLFVALSSGLCPEANAAQRDRSNKPLPAPLLPAEEAWNVVLPSPASAAGALDAERVYIPLQSGLSWLRSIEKPASPSGMSRSRARGHQ